MDTTINYAAAEATTTPRAASPAPRTRTAVRVVDRATTLADYAWFASMPVTMAVMVAACCWIAVASR